MESFVEYWNRKEASNKTWAAAAKFHTFATYGCGCELAYSGIGYRQSKWCNQHPKPPLKLFSRPVPPIDQLAEVAKAGIVTLRYVE